MPGFHWRPVNALSISAISIHSLKVIDIKYAFCILSHTLPSPYWSLQFSQQDNSAEYPNRPQTQIAMAAKKPTNWWLWTKMLIGYAHAIPLQ